MTKREIIDLTMVMIQNEAYVARVCEELLSLGFDSDMMKYYRDVASGKAFGGLQILSHVTGKDNANVYDEAVEIATQDIEKVSFDIINLLNLAGFSGEAYYKSYMKLRA